MSKPRFVTLVGIIAAVALTRLLPHPWNFSPVGAMALFGGAHFTKKWQAFLLPIAALFLSDLVIGFYDGMALIYLSFCVNVLIGMMIREHRRRVGPVAAAAFIGSVQFFVITNFATWLNGLLYPLSMAGLSQCYIAAIPFFGWTVLGDAVFTAVLFGSFALAEAKFPALQEAPLTA
jgi:hypothetical protein